MKPLDVIAHLDIPRYMGTWYEIAKYPNRFQRKCDGATATYTLEAGNTVRVLNRCVRPDGTSTSISGRAWVVDPITNAKLRVRFFWPFSGKYWVIDIGRDYEFAVVSEPRRKYLWILARTPSLDQAALNSIFQRLEANGFEPRALQWSKHSR